ncbi:hypothetical protein IPJ91_01540 [bacterium]|nr:MAG: hypothetical protein IPJ91_01540 [bacterium]
MPKYIEETLMDDILAGYWSDEEVENIAADRMPWEWEKKSLERVKSRDLLTLVERYTKMKLPLGLSDRFLIDCIIFDKKLIEPSFQDLKLLAEYYSTILSTMGSFGINHVLNAIGPQYEDSLREKGLVVVKDIEKAILKLRKIKAKDKERLEYLK